MVQARVLQIVRQFWENAIKLLLEDPRNVRDLLALCGADIVQQIDLRRLKLIQTTFVERDYRHVESDVVLLAPPLTYRCWWKRRLRGGVSGQPFIHPANAPPENDSRPPAASRRIR